MSNTVYICINWDLFSTEDYETVKKMVLHEFDLLWHNDGYGPGRVRAEERSGDSEIEVSEYVAAALTDAGFCIGVPDFTVGDVGITEGNRKAARIAVAAVRRYDRLLGYKDG